MATTMKSLEILRGTGLPSHQAEAILQVVEEQNEAALLRNWMVDTFSTKLELAEVKAELVKWMAGFGLTTVALILAGVYFILGHFKG